MIKSVEYVAALVAILCSLEGCVSTRTAGLSNDNATVMRGKSLVVSRRARPDFAAMTAGKAMFGMIGAAAMISAGNKIVTDDDIADPAAYIGAQLATALEQRYGLTESSGTPPIASTTDPRELASLYSTSDYVLDVQTVNWSFVYRPSLTHYRVLYSVKVRLIDTHRPKLVATAFCYRKDDADTNPPTHDQLLADHAALLKRHLQDHASKCVGELERKIYGEYDGKP